MKTEELIDSLVHEAGPVRRLPSPLALAAGLTLCALAVSMAGAWLMGMRPDLHHVMETRRFIMINTMLVIALGGLSLMLGTLSVPGRHRMKLLAGLGVAMAAVVTVLLLMRWPWFAGVGWGAWFLMGAFCTARTLLLGGLPAVAGVWLFRHGASTHPAVSGGLVGGAAGSQGANAMGWSCDIDEPMHVLVFHFVLPTAILALLGVWAGRRWLRW